MPLTFEARDQAPPKEKKPKDEPKKRGRKSKEEREQRLVEKAEQEDNLFPNLQIYVFEFEIREKIN